MVKSTAQLKKQKVYSKKTDIYFLCILISLIALTFLNLTVYFTRETRVVLSARASTYEREINYWKNFLENNPTYKDGWIELTQIEYNLGNIGEAKKFLEVAEKIDPSDEAILSLKQMLKI